MRESCAGETALEYWWVAIAVNDLRESCAGGTALVYWWVAIALNHSRESGAGGTALIGFWWEQPLMDTSFKKTSRKHHREQDIYPPKGKNKT